jgi:hypothetical protein
MSLNVDTQDTATTQATVPAAPGFGSLSSAAHTNDSGDDGFDNVSLGAITKKTGGVGFQELYRKAQDALKTKISPNTLEKIPVDLIPLDTALPQFSQLHAPGIIAVAPGKDDGNLYYTVLVFQDPSRDPGTREVPTNSNGNIKTVWHLTDMDCYDNVYENTVKAAVQAWARTKGFERLVPTNVMGCLVSSNYKTQDDNAMAQLINTYAIIPLWTAKVDVQQANGKPMDLTRMSQGKRLESVVAYAGVPHQEHTTGTVHNARFMLAVNKVTDAKNSGNGMYSMNDGTQRDPQTLSGGYLDVIPADEFVGTPQASNLQVVPGYGVPARKPQLNARVVMTILDSPNLNTLQMQLLSLGSTILHFRRRENLIDGFLATSSSQEQASMWSIAGLNVLANIDKKTTGQSEPIADINSADINQKVELFNQMVADQTAYTLRISRLGQDSYHNSIFLQAANPANRDHAQRIVEAANALTGGRLAAILAGQSITPVMPGVTLVPLGYYTDSEGTKRDLSDVNAVTIMNRVGRGGNASMLEALKAYYMAFDGQQDDAITRLETLRKLYKELLGSSVVFTGTGYIVNIDGRFATALAEAIFATGKAPVLTNGSNIGLGSTRFAPVWSQNAFSQSSIGAYNPSINSGASVGMPNFVMPGQRSF